MTPYFDEDGVTLFHGDCREVLSTLSRRLAAVGGTMTERRPCRACGRQLMFAPVIDADGKPVLDDKGRPKTVPLDMVAPVFEVVECSETGAVVGAVRAYGSFVSHFATCTDPNRFSRKRRS